MSMIKKYPTGVLFLLLALAALCLAGAVYALFTASLGAKNELATKSSEVYLQEYFSPGDLWVAGETKDKQVWFGNQDDQTRVIRFKTTTEWYDNNGTPDNLSDDTAWSYSGVYDPEPAAINWTEEITGDEPAWTKIGDYYYYNKALAGKTKLGPEETPPVIESVTFSPWLSNSAYGDDDFSNKSCRITIRMESLAVNPAHTGEAWGVTFTQEEDVFVWSSVDQAQ